MEKRLEAKYGSADKPLMINDIEIPCYVLEDGKRVIVQRGLYKALGITRGGVTEKYKEFGGGARLVRFLDQNELIPLFDGDLRAVLKSPVVFEVNKTIHYGYEAIVLQEITKQISKAYLKGELLPGQDEIGANAEVLYDAFAKVGIIALVDEVTGYQEDREKDALQVFFKKFFNEDRYKWLKTFPDEFWESLFRMRGLNWSLANKGRKPQYLGHDINNYVYSRLAPLVLSELRRLNPKDSKGNRKSKHTQWINMDYGHPKLQEHLNILIALAKASGYNFSNWKRMVERALPKFDEEGNQQQRLDID